LGPNDILPMTAIAVSAGFLGSMLGLGGGIIIIPALTLVFRVPFPVAVGASIVSVIATSTSATAVYIREGYVNLRLGLVLELATVAGAVVGGFLGVWMNPRYLEALFGALMLYAGWNMLRAAGEVHPEPVPQSDEGFPHPHDHEFVDRASGRTLVYRPRATLLGSAISAIAGLQSGMLGVGGGIIKVPVMNLIMGVPLKAAIATSNYMIGITAATSAMVYYAHGKVVPLIAGPCAAGVLIGAQIGSRVGPRLKTAKLRWIFVALLVFASYQMFRKALGAG